MTAADFTALQARLFDRCKNLTDTKNKDYTKGNEDFLAFFKESGVDLDIPELKATGLMMKKHINAVYAYIKNEGSHESEPIEERIADAVNYLTFILALIKEKE